MFIVTEIQTTADGVVSTIVNSYADRNQAESQYHHVLSAAAVSALPVHACTMYTEAGFHVKSECYTHPQAEEA